MADEPGHGRAKASEAGGRAPDEETGASGRRTVQSPVADDGQRRRGGGRVVAGEGIRSAGVKATSVARSSRPTMGRTRRGDKAEVEELAAGSRRRSGAESGSAAAGDGNYRESQTQVEQQADAEPLRTVGRRTSTCGRWKRRRWWRRFTAAARWRLGVRGQGRAANRTSDSASSSDPNVTLHPPASPYTVMAGSVIPAVLVSGIDSDLPGPILAQVSENVFDSASGRSSADSAGQPADRRYRNASSYGQQRVQIAWQRLIFPNTSSMDLPQMPGTDQGGYAGFTDQVNNHYLATFGTAAVTSLISAGQMVGQMAAFGGGGTYGPSGYYQPNQWAMAGETAGSAGVRAVGRARPADAGAGHEPTADDRDQAGLRIQRDGDRGPGVSGSVQGLEAQRDCQSSA